MNAASQRCCSDRHRRSTDCNFISWNQINGICTVAHVFLTHTHISPNTQSTNSTTDSIVGIYLLDWNGAKRWLTFFYFSFHFTSLNYYCYYLSSVKCTKESSSARRVECKLHVLVCLCMHARILPSIFINVNHSAVLAFCIPFDYTFCVRLLSWKIFTDGKMHVRSEHDTALDEKRTLAREPILNCAPYHHQRLPVRRCVVVDFNS